MKRANGLIKPKRLLLALEPRFLFDAAASAAFSEATAADIASAQAERALVGMANPGLPGVVPNAGNAPQANNDKAAVTEDVALSGNVILGGLAGELADSDADGDNLNVVAATVDANANGSQNNLVLDTPTVITASNGLTAGTLVLRADGSYTFTPAPAYNGDVPAVTYTIADSVDGTDTATLELRVLSVADEPVITVAGTPDMAVGTEDTALVFSAANGNAITIDDEDSPDGSGLLEVKLEVTPGAATVALAGINNLQVTGNGTDSVVVYGSINNINAALNGLRVTPSGDLNETGAPVTLSVIMDSKLAFSFINSGFELRNIPNGVFRLVSEILVPGWDTSAPDGRIEFWGNGFLGRTAYEGNQFVELNANVVSTLSQQVTSIAGLDMSFSFAHRGRNGNDELNVTVTDLGPDGVKGTVDDAILLNKNYRDGRTAWGFYSESLGTASGNNVLLEFNSISAAGGSRSIGNFLDSVNIEGESSVARQDIELKFAPVVDTVADSLTTPEDTAITANVLTGSNGASADNFEGAPVLAGVTQGANGSVTFNANGAATYTPAANFTGTDTFTYTVTSPAGVVETETVTVNVTPEDDPIGIADVAGAPSVAEAGLASGSAPASTVATGSGNFSVTAVDGLQDLQVGSTTVSAAALANLGTTPVVVTGSHGDLTLTAFDAATGEVSYSYTLTDAVDHSGGAVADSFALQVTDIDGDTANDDLVIGITDDTPVAVADNDESVAVASDTRASGNLLLGIAAGLGGFADTNTTDGNADLPGADGGLALSTVTGTAAAVPVTVATSIAGQFGTLLVDSTGAYVYTPDASNADVAGLLPGGFLDEVFNYEVSDADGSSASTQLTIRIVAFPAIIGLGDGLPVAGSDGVVLEADLASGSNPVGGSETLAGSFELLSPDGVQSLAVTDAAGNAVPVSEAALLAASPALPVTISRPNGNLLLTGYNTTTQVVSYEFELTSPVDNSATANTLDLIPLEFTDGATRVVSGTLGIEIVDDVPVARNDSNTIAAGGAAAVGNLLSDGVADSTGADGVAAGGPVSQVAGVAPGNGLIAGSYGALTVNAAGDYTYAVADTAAVRALAPGDSVTDVFSYTIIDADGSTATAALTVTVQGVNDLPVVMDDDVSLAEDTSINGSVLGNDSDPDGDALVIVSAQIDADGDGAAEPLALGVAKQLRDSNGELIGTVSLNAAGDYSYQPAANRNGTVPELIYTAADPLGASASGELRFDVTPVNDAVSLAGLLVGSDGLSDASVDERDLIDGTTPNETGEIATGAFLAATPDGLQSLVVAGVTLDSTALAALSAATPQIISGAHGELSLEGYDALTGVLNYSYQLTSAASHAGGISPADAFALSLRDVDGDVAAASLAIAIADDSPLAQADLESTLSTNTTPVTGNVVTGNDQLGADGAGASGAVTRLTGAVLSNGLSAANVGRVFNGRFGRLTLNSDGGYSYLVNTDNATVRALRDGAEVTDVFHYELSDADGDAGISTLSISIFGPLVDPVATPSLSAGDEDTAIAVALGGTDLDGTVVSLTVTALPLASQGELQLADGSLVVAGVPLSPLEAAGLSFLPAANYNGSVTLAFFVTDNDGLDSAPANEVITVHAVNDLPVGVAGNAAGSEDSDVAVALTATDVDGTVVSLSVPALPSPAEGVLLLPDGTPLVAGATLTPAAASALVFRPAENFNGVSVIGFTALDDQGGVSASADFTVSVSDVNDAPEALAGNFGTAEDMAVGLPLTGSDVDGMVVSLTLVALPLASEGTVTRADGTPVVAGSPIAAADAAGLIFTPAADFNGAVNLAFFVTDDDGADSAAAGVAIAVAAVNDAPVATPSTSIGLEDTAITVDLAGTDVDGTVATVTVTGLPAVAEGMLLLPDGSPVVAGVSISVAQAGALVFVPAANFNGSVVVPFTVTDDSAESSAPATEQITVTAVNDAPVATPASFAGNEDTPVVVSLAGSDIDHAVATVTLAALPLATEGLLTLADGSPVIAGVPIAAADAAALVFTPAANFNGSVTLAFLVTDSAGANSVNANAIISVASVNDEPVATASNSVGLEDATIPVDLAGTDVDGVVVAVTVTGLPAVTEGVLLLPDGSPVVAGVPVPAAQASTLNFVPADDFNGVVDIQFTVTDDSAESSAPATEQITVAAVNDAPVATPTVASGDEDTSIMVSLAGADVDGSIVSITLATLPPAAEGALSLPDGSPVIVGDSIAVADAASLIFTPAADFSGAVMLEFVATDDEGADSASASATINVMPVNDAPVATASTSTGLEDVPIQVDLAGMDVDGTVVTVTVAGLPDVTEGVLLLPDDSPVVAGVPVSVVQASMLNFVPSDDFNGIVDIQFTVTDDSAESSALATEQITVIAVNDAPIATPVNATGDEDTLIAVALAGSDVDSAIVSVTVTALPPAAEGVLTRPDGSAVVAGSAMSAADAAALVFTPAEDFNGQASFQFHVTDGDGADSASAVAIVSVAPVNDAPVATASMSSGMEDMPVPVELLGTDLDGVITSVLVAGLPDVAEGVLLLPDGSPVIAGVPISAAQASALSFVPASNFNGTVDVQFTVTDDSAESSAPSTEQITVSAVNDAPVATPSAASGDEDTPIAVALAGTDVEGDVVSLIVGSLPLASEGVLTLPDGSPVVVGSPIAAADAENLIFTPATDFNGVVMFTFVATDAEGADSVGASATITVAAVNDAPVATPSTSAGLEDTPIPVDLAGSDVDGVVSSVTVAALPSVTEGVLQLPDGSPVITGVPVSAAQASALSFVPAPNFSGTVDIQFTVTDDSAESSAPATEQITVTAVNDAPVAAPGSFTGDEDTAVVVSLGGNDIDGVVASVTLGSAPLAAEGVLTLPNGVAVVAGTPISVADAAALTFTPAANFNGPVLLSFLVTDSSGADSLSATATISVASLNDAPVAIASQSGGMEDTPIPVALGGSDIDGVVDSVVVAALPLAAEGVLLLPDGSSVLLGQTISAADAAILRFVPATNFNGDAAIRFTVTDDAGATSAPATELISVSPVNDVPVALPVSAIGDEDTPISVVLAGSDIDSPAPGFRFTSLPPASSGILTLANGTPVSPGVELSAIDAAGLLFVPADNFNGVVLLEYEALDDAGAVSPPATLTVQINDVNDLPVARDDLLLDRVTNNPAIVDVLTNDSDVDGVLQPDTIRIMGTSAAGSTLVVAGEGEWQVDGGAGTVTFVPEPGFTADPTPISYQVQDDDGDLSLAASIRIDYAVTEPVAVQDVVQGERRPGPDQPFPPVRFLPLQNDSDPDGALDAASLRFADGPTGSVLSADGLTLTVPGEGVWQRSGSAFVFTPELNLRADPTPVRYSVADNDGNRSDEAALYADYPPYAPRVGDDKVFGLPVGATAAIAILANDAGDDELDPDSVWLVGAAAPGDALTVAGEGVWQFDAQTQQLVFTPDPDFAGDPAPIAYSVADLSGERSAPALVVADYEVPPRLDLNDAFDTADPDFSGVYVEDGPPAAIVAADFGVDDGDDRLLQSARVFIVDLQADDRLLINGSSASRGAVAGIAYERSATEIHFTGPATVASYRLALAAITFENTSEAPQSTAREFRVTLSDGNNSSASATSRISVVARNDPPLALQTTTLLSGPAPAPIELQGSDLDGEIASFTLLALPDSAAGTLSFADGSPAMAGLALTPDQVSTLLFTPAPGFNGSTSLQFLVSDDGGALSEANAHHIQVADNLIVPVEIEPPIDMEPGVPEPVDEPPEPSAVGLDMNFLLAGAEVSANADGERTTWLHAASEDPIVLAAIADLSGLNDTNWHFDTRPFLGGSSLTASPTDPRNDSEQLMIDATRFADRLHVLLGLNPAASGEGDMVWQGTEALLSYTVTQPHGTALPAWVADTGRGVVVVHPPAGESELLLQVKARFATGSVTRTVVVDLLTAEVAALLPTDRTGLRFTEALAATSVY